MSRRACSRRTIALLLLTVHLPACTSYRTVADPVAALQPSPKPVKKARVTIDSGRRFEVMAPRVTGDSLQGTLRNGNSVGVALSEIREVEVRGYDGARTGLLVLGGVLAAIVAGIAIAALAILDG